MTSLVALDIAGDVTPSRAASQPAADAGECSSGKTSNVRVPAHESRVGRRVVHKISPGIPEGRPPPENGGPRLDAQWQGTVWPRRRLTGRRTGSRALSFFFQAEDGIRDLTVTGVQTCALPI